MKKILVALLAAAVLSLSACTSATNSSVSESVASASETESTSAETESTPAETESTPAETESAPSANSEETDPSKPVIALTFDDGPNTTTTVQVLDLLEKYNITASFFLVGNNITPASEEVVKRAYDMGCEINNHSKTHSYMDQMTKDEIRAEVQYVSDKVKEITGEPTKFFRPPYIAVNNDMYECVDMPFISGVGCNDWDAKVSVEKRVAIIERKAKDGTIILLHDAAGNSQTVEALDRIIPTLLEKGYQFVTVSELFKAKGIEISGEDTNLYSVLE